MRELGDRDKMLDELRRQVDMSGEEKEDCERTLASVKRRVDSLTVQLEQKHVELDQARSLVRFSSLL